MMFAVIFEFQVSAARRQDYLAFAAALRPDVDKLDGFLGIERFENVRDAERMVSFSTWRDEAAIARWRLFAPHRSAQDAGRSKIFDDYRLRVGEVVASGASVAVTEGRDLGGKGEMFVSIVTPGKMLLLGEPASGGSIERSLAIRIIRDYGMHDRAQAPQSLS